MLTRKTYVAPSTVHGFGVFAAKDLEKDELVDECVGLLCRLKKKTCARNPTLNDYIFSTRSSYGNTWILLGNGALYNHCFTPNVERFEPDDGNIEDGDVVHEFYALRDIKAGEELFINYGKGYCKARNITQ